MVLELTMCSSATPCSAVGLLGFWNSEHDETRKWDGMGQWTEGGMDNALRTGRTDVNVEIVM